MREGRGSLRHLAESLLVHRPAVLAEAPAHCAVGMTGAVLAPVGRASRSSLNASAALGLALVLPVQSFGYLQPPS